MNIRNINSRMNFLFIAIVLLALCPMAHGQGNVTVDRDTLQILYPAGFAKSNDLASAVLLEAYKSMLSDEIQSNATDRASLTNITATGATVTMSNRTAHIVVTPSTGSAEYVSAEFHDHETNASAHGGTVLSPTNTALTGWSLRYSESGRPYYAPVQASDLIISYTTNLVWSDELDGGDFDYATNQAAAWGGRLPTRDELVAMVLTSPGWNPNVGYYWSGTITTPGNAYLVDYANGDVYDVPTMGEYDVRAVKEVITSTTALDAFSSHIGQTTDAHGGVMRSASNPGANGQILYINTATGRPYWGTPAIEGGIQYLLTSGVARVNGRYVTTNYTVTVSNGTWDGSTATLTPTGMITVVSTVPIARWEYSHSTHIGMGLTDLIDTWAWVTNTHGLLSAGDIYSVRSIGNETADIPSIGEEGPVSISLSNLVVWTWGAPGLCGTTNSFEGTHVTVDDPAGELDPVNLRTMQERIDEVFGSMTPSRWADYDANGAGNKIDGVNMGGRRVYLDNQWSMLGSGNYFALSYNGKDILYVSMSNRLLSIAGFTPGPLMTVRVSTNTVTSKPWIEYTTDLTAGNWIEITNATSTYPTKTNGSYVMTFSSVWPTAYFRAVQASTNVNGLVVTVPLTVPAITLGGITKTSWPVGERGPAGKDGTNTQVTVFVGAAKGDQGVPGYTPVKGVDYWDGTVGRDGRDGLSGTNGAAGRDGTDGRDGRDGLPGQDGVIGRDGLPGISPTINIGNVTTGTTAAVTNTGNSTNVILDIVIPPGPQGPIGPGMTNLPAVWDADLISTNALFQKVGGQNVTRIDSNGITMIKGTLQMYEEDLSCNVRLWGGTRLAPSLTFQGHTNEWGLYDRGYNGHTIAGWSVAGSEVGLLWDGGIKLMTTNAAFDGKHLGDISGATGYPEPLFRAWNTNMNFSVLTLSNMTVTPGGIDVKDTLSTTRTRLDTTGMTYKNAGGIIRLTSGTEVYIKDELGRNRTMLDLNGVTTYDGPSQMPILGFGSLSLDAVSCKFTGGNLVWMLNSTYGLRLWDPYQTGLRFGVNYQGMQIYNASSQAVFSVDSGTTPLITMWNTVITNSGNLTFYGAVATNLLTLTGASGDIKALGRTTVGNLSLTNNGAVSFYATGGALMATITATNGGIQAFGRNIFSTNWPSGNSTNLGIGGRTNVYQFQSGYVTNIIIL
ncbi:MAG: hypothetical protein WCS52_01895 [bacterium]